MITEKFGRRIKELRNAKGISQEKFALSIDMDRTYYASVETGNRNISLNNIEKIANGFGITLEELRHPHKLSIRKFHDKIILSAKLSLSFAPPAKGGRFVALEDI